MARRDKIAAVRAVLGAREDIRGLIRRCEDLGDLRACEELKRRLFREGDLSLFLRAVDKNSSFFREALSRLFSLKPDHAFKIWLKAFPGNVEGFFRECFYRVSLRKKPFDNVDEWIRFLGKGVSSRAPVAYLFRDMEEGARGGDNYFSSIGLSACREVFNEARFQGFLSEVTDTLENSGILDFEGPDYSEKNMGSGITRIGKLPFEGFIRIGDYKPELLRVVILILGGPDFQISVRVKAPSWLLEEFRGLSLGGPVSFGRGFVSFGRYSSVLFEDNLIQDVRDLVDFCGDLILIIEDSIAEAELGDPY